MSKSLKGREDSGGSHFLFLFFCINRGYKNKNQAIKPYLVYDTTQLSGGGSTEVKHCKIWIHKTCVPIPLSCL